MSSGVKEGKFAEPLEEGVVAEGKDVLEDRFIRNELNERAGLVAGHRAEVFHRGDLDLLSVRHHEVLDLPVDDLSLLELKAIGMPVPVDGKPQPLGKGVHAGNADTMQTARDLVAVFVELSARVKFREGDFSSASLRLMLVVKLHIVRDAAAVVQNGDRAVTADRDDDVLCKPGEDFIN